MKGLSSIRTVFFLALCCSALSSHAQDVIRSTDTVIAPKPPKPSPSKPVLRIKPKGPKAVKSEVSVGFRLNTNGWSAYTDFGKVKSKDSKRADMFNSVTLLQLELSEKKSPRQTKINGDGSSSGSTSYVYGKINNFYGIKLGVGYRKLLAGKPDQGSVSIHWVNVIGGSLGLLKPYYINVNDQGSAIKYSPDNRDKFLNQANILGSAGLSQGLGEMTYIPGGHFKSALHFDFAANRKVVSAVEVGFNAEVYAQQIKLMANEDGTNYFFDLFVAIQFGKRW